MIRNILKAIFPVAFIIGCISLTSCEDEPVIWDYNPVVVEFEIVDGDNTDLIAEGGSLHGSEMSLSYNSQDYEAQWEGPKESRYYMPMMYGLYFKSNGVDENAKLIFGELDGDCGDVDLVLNMPNGSKHTLQISRHIKNKNKYLVIKQTVKLDGIELNEHKDGSPHICITIKY